MGFENLNLTVRSWKVSDSRKVDIFYTDDKNQLYLDVVVALEGLGFCGPDFYSCVDCCVDYCLSAFKSNYDCVTIFVED